ncbi:Phospholipase C [Arachnomyces sp. PD_36]|nr:Phospholipase C [Arachnomyces sp. PD_36]
MSSTASAPHAVNGDSYFRSRPPPFSRPSQLHHVLSATTPPIENNNPIPPQPSELSALAPSTSAPATVGSNVTTGPSAPRNIPADTISPVFTPLQTALDGSGGLQATTILASPGPLELPESVMAVPASIINGSNSTDGAGANNKAPGLMRRISRGAANKLTRRRQSTSHHDKRDHSSGPVIMRRRSDSKTGSTTSKDGALDTTYGEEVEEVEESFGTWRGSEGTYLASTSETPTTGAMEAGSIAPKVDAALQHGTTLTKVTKKKRKLMKFCLDLDAAKVYWNPQNPAKRFYIDDIKEIRVGADARNYREEHQVPEDAASRWFTILFADPDRSSKNRPIKTMHLIAPDNSTFEMWTTTLEHISRYRIGLMTGMAGSGQSEAILKAHWQREMSRLLSSGPPVGGKESLDLSAVENLCRSLHINCSRNMIRAQFTKADTVGNARLDFVEFKDFLRRLKERKDVKELYKKIAVDHKGGMTLEEFFMFLRDSQGENVDTDASYWMSIFEKFIRKAKSRAQDLPNSRLPLTDALGYARMNLEAFSLFLSSTSNAVYSPLFPQSRFDRPLNEYFISTSHNTYLLGRQVAGASSTEAYITALQQGCRCVEIDCWDGADGRPIVSHGRTMTSSVMFADCISVINRYAFLHTDFPLILSLEVHCNPEQQAAMVAIMKDILGDQLLLEPLMTNCAILPSPEELKRRILVKVKVSESSEENGLAPEVTVTGRKRSASSPFARSTVVPDSPMLGASPPMSSPGTMSPIDTPNSVWTPGRRSQTATSMSSASDDSDALAISTRAEKVKRQKSRIVKELADLGVYTRGYKFRNFNTVESRRYNHVFSFAERSFESICRDPENKAQLEKHNRRYLARVYPSGFRLRSSNFDPNIFWRRGVQMVALNWQTYDVGMQMNQAMFAAGSDRTGYVLKPESLRTTASPSSMADGDSGRPKANKKLVRFSVDMISAQQLPRPRGMGADETINPYVEIEMFSADDKGKSVAVGEGGMNASSRTGMSGIGLPHRRRTKIEQSNGYSPIFNDQFKLSLETKYPDLVFVRWVVWNSLDGRNAGTNNCVQLATFTAKLSSLSRGYRYLPLYDSNGDQYLFSTLFCRITREDSPFSLPLNLEEMKAERLGIFRQIGQSVFKRTLSIDRDRDRSRDKHSVLDEEQAMVGGFSPELTPVLTSDRGSISTVGTLSN